jgi:hypothetical protein
VATRQRDGPTITGGPRQLRAAIEGMQGRDQPPGGGSREKEDVVVGLVVVVVVAVVVAVLVVVSMVVVLVVVGAVCVCVCVCVCLCVGAVCGGVFCRGGGGVVD